MRRRAALGAAVLVLALGSGARAQSPAVTEGLRVLEDWQLEQALEVGRRLLKDTPQDPEAWLLAGRIQHQRGEHGSALALLDAARAAGVDTSYVHDLVKSSAAYAAHFQSLDTEHFRIRYLNKDEILASYAGPVLEAAYRNIGRELEFLPAEKGEKIVVEIYPDAQGLAGATGLTVKEIATSGTIAVCKFHRLMITSPLATAEGYPWADTVAHEFVHLVISKKSQNNIPIWLHEGIAKYYESAWKGAPGEALEPFSEKLLADAVRKRELITYQQMHPSMAKLPSQEDAALAFAEVFTTVEFLTKKFGPGAIPQVLELAGQGVPLERALRQVFKLDLGGIETAWKRWLAKREFHIVPGAAPQKITLAAEGSGNSEEKPLETMADREVHDFSRLGELLQLRGHDHAAVVEYEKAYTRSGLQYSSLLYRLARGYIALDKKQEALDLLDKTLTVHPNNSDVHLLAGRLRFERQDVQGAAEDFQAVRLQNPFNPEIHGALADLYLKQGKEEAARLEQRFLELSRKPPTPRNYELPAPPNGNAFVSIVSPRWDAVRIDADGPVASPLWNRPIVAGTHTVEYRTADGRLTTKDFSVAVGEHQTLVLE